MMPLPFPRVDVSITVRHRRRRVPCDSAKPGGPLWL